MRKWDIVEVVQEPNQEVAPVRRNTGAIKNLVTSAVKTVCVVSLAVASPAYFTVRANEHAAIPTAQVHFVNYGQRTYQSALALRQQAPSETDTQFGQSSAKLAQLFEAYFVQAPDEEVYEDDYSFS